MTDAPLVHDAELVGAGADRIRRLVRRALLVDDDRRVDAEVKQRLKLGSLNLSTTVSGSGVSIDSIEAKNALSLLVESLAAKRSNENLTSFEENGSPSWNLTLGLSVKVSVLRSGEKSHFSASSGVTEKSSLIFVSPSKIVVVGHLADRRGRRAGRIEPGRLEHHADRDAVLGEGEAGRGEEGEAEREAKRVDAAHEDAPEAGKGARP